MRKTTNRTKVILFFASSLFLASLISLSEVAGLISIGLVAFAVTTDRNFRKLF